MVTSSKAASHLPDRRVIKDRRVNEVPLAQGAIERRKKPDRRLPEVQEVEVSEDQLKMFRAKANPVTSPSPSSSVDAYVKPLILAIDDSPFDLRILATAFKDEYEFRFALSAEEAFEQCNRLTPDAILLDVMMPRIDGFEVFRRLKAEKRTAGTPIVFITASSSREHERTALKRGAADFMTKPLDVTVALLKIKNLVAQAKERKFLIERVSYLENLVVEKVMEIKKMTQQPDL